MSYTAHTWTAGETVTAEKLNALENGIAGYRTGVLISNLIPGITDENNTYYDVSLAEILNAFTTGARVILKNQLDIYDEIIEIEYDSARDIYILYSIFSSAGGLFYNDPDNLLHERIEHFV